jgi:hypothetical protein
MAGKFYRLGQSMVRSCTVRNCSADLFGGDYLLQRRELVKKAG